MSEFMRSILKSSIATISALVMTGLSGISAQAASMTNDELASRDYALNISTPSLKRNDQDTLLSSPFLNVSPKANHTAALNFIRQTGLNKNLSLLLLDTMKTDAVVVAAIKRSGMKKVQPVVVGAILQEQIKFKPAWDNALASVYSEMFSAQELSSLTTERDLSPHFSKLVEMQSQIGQQINQSAADILNAAERTVRARIEAELGA
jgi:hypothetical protein